MGHLAVASCSVRSALRSMATTLVPCVEEYVQNTLKMPEVSLKQTINRSLSGCSIITGLRDIKVLAVRCDNVDRGCTWTGTVGTIEDHVGEKTWTAT